MTTVRVGYIALALSAGLCAAQAQADETPTAYPNTFAAADGTTYTGDPARGARMFNQCGTCHSLKEGENRQGPSLHGLVGRHSGVVENFRYSKAAKEADIVWTPQALFDYLENPRTYMPGNIMAYAGMKRPQDRADVIAHIADAAGTPLTAPTN